MNTLDLIVLAIVAVSALFAFLRGFVRELLGILAWLGAGLAAIYLYGPLAPLFARLIHATWLAEIVEPVAIFVVVLVLLSLVTGMISAGVRQSGFGSADRALGLAFGVVRGVVVVCILAVALDFVMPEHDRPDWIKQARTLPMLEAGASAFKAWIPPEFVERGTEAAKDAADKMHRAEAIRQGYDALGGDNPLDKSRSGSGDGAAPDEPHGLDQAVEDANKPPQAKPDVKPDSKSGANPSNKP